MRKIVVFMHVSLDGYTARPNGAMDWIKVDEKIFDYAQKRTAEADTALYGRKTFELMDAYWPTAADEPKASKHDIDHGSWYNRVEKLIVSKTMAGRGDSKKTIISDDVSGQIARIKEKAGREIIIFGSPSLVAYLTQHRLIDDYWLMINPVILGQGIPLFKDAQQQIDLKLEESISFSGGVMGVHYSKSL